MKSGKIIILIVAWICSIVCTAVVVSVVKDNSYEPKQSTSVNDEENGKTESSDPISQTNYENWGFENIEEWGGTLLKIYPDENGNFVFSDAKGKYVRTTIDSAECYRVYPDREEFVMCSINVDHTLFDYSALYNYRVMDNNTLVLRNFAGDSGFNLRIDGRTNENGVHIGLLPAGKYYDQIGIIPYQYIDTEITMEFCESVNIKYSEYIETYEDYYKVYLK